MSEKLNTQTIKVLEAIIQVTLERLQRNLVAEYAEALNLAVDDDYPDIIDDFTGEVFEVIFSTHPSLDIAEYRFPMAEIAEKILIDSM